MTTNDVTIEVQGFQLQDSPRIYLSAIAGNWLLQHSTPSWRIDDPERGFQRIVKETRARAIALAVLDQQRTFPNSIILATDRQDFPISETTLMIHSDTRFLVVDGQHRLWAQKYSDYEATYSCVIHTGLTEVEMAKLFVEINNNQKRVPPSLRWDLVRLIRPEENPEETATADLVFLLTTEEDSPLYQRIDLTGEQPELRLKLGSIAPAIKPLFTSRSPINELSINQKYQIITQYFIAIKETDNDGWRSGNSVFYSNRVIRALMRLLHDLIRDIQEDRSMLRANHFLPYLQRIERETLNIEAIRAAQGGAGIRAIYDQIHGQVFG